MLAIIGGSGLAQIPGLAITHRRIIRTPYGEPSAPVTFGEICGNQAVFLARHGIGHSIPPHEINYRANLWALRECGARMVVSVATVGGIRGDLVPGTLVAPTQIIDYTWGRKHTYFEGGSPVKHIDFTLPYDGGVRNRLLQAALECGVPMTDGAVYAVTQGPRLESAAEISRLERDGADVVGMTAMPEAALSRELELPYAAIAVVANYAAGRGESTQAVDLAAIERVLAIAMEQAVKVVIKFAKFDT